MIKSHDWPLILIFSGVPELEGYLREEPQLYRLVNRVEFKDIALPEDYATVHEIVGSYALHANLTVHPDMLTEDFYHRLVTAGAYRWGLVIKLTTSAIGVALAEGAVTLSRGSFVTAWAAKTNTNPAATPFTHSDFETMYRKDHPFFDILSA